MSEPSQKLTAAQVREAGPEHWRQVFTHLKARFRTGDLRTGLALVDGIGTAALAADAEPQVVLTPADVVVGLSSSAVHGITARELELARRIDTVAAGLGVAADVAGLTQLELGLDTTAGEHLAPFYAALLGAQVERGEPVDPSGQVPTVWWQDPTETDEGLTLPPQSFPQRWHFDVWVPHDDAERRVRAVLAAGGRLVSDAAAPAYWVVEDVDGNRACICTPFGR